MACKDARTRRLRALELTYPIWFFDLDQQRWPRKLVTVLPGSRPAKILGWLPWRWEYGTDLWHLDDPLPQGVIDTSPQNLGPVEKVLDRLRFDPSLNPNTFQIVYDAGSGAGTANPFSEWYFSPRTDGFVAHRRISRIERTWDHTPLWDRQSRTDLIVNDQLRLYTSYGVASLVSNDAELVMAAGVPPEDNGDKIRKADFDLLDGEQESVRGIVYSGRMQSDRDVHLERGPDLSENREALAGTALQDASWSDVEDYVNGVRDGPLM